MLLVAAECPTWQNFAVCGQWPSANRPYTEYSLFAEDPCQDYHVFANLFPLPTVALGVAYFAECSCFSSRQRPRHPAYMKILVVQIEVNLFSPPFFPDYSGYMCWARNPSTAAAQSYHLRQVKVHRLHLTALSLIESYAPPLWSGPTQPLPSTASTVLSREGPHAPLLIVDEGVNHSQLCAGRGVRGLLPCMDPDALA